MIDLKGKQVQAFRDALLKAFSAADLTMMVRFELSEDLDQIVDPGKLEKRAYDLVLWAEKSTRLDDLLAGALKERPRNPWLRSFAIEVTLTSSDTPAPGLEAWIVKGVPFQDTVSWRARMERAERCVCRVEMPAGTPIGTGFLVGPDVIMTNYHVALAPGSGGTGAVRFDYRKDAAGNDPAGATLHPFAAAWHIDSSPVDGPGFTGGLDYALVRLADKPGDARGVLRPGVHTFVKDEPLLILQHPSTTPLKLGVGSVGNVALLPNRVGYSANTEPGSSGSPCFDIGWNLVAIHHFGEAGVENRGIPLSTIVAKLREKNVAVALGW